VIAQNLVVKPININRPVFSAAGVNSAKQLFDAQPRHESPKREGYVDVNNMLNDQGINTKYSSRENTAQPGKNRNNGKHYMSNLEMKGVPLNNVTSPYGVDIKGAHIEGEELSPSVRSPGAQTSYLHSQWQDSVPVL